MYIYRSQSSLKHSEIRSDLKIIVLVVSLVWIKIILCGLLLLTVDNINILCSYVLEPLETGLRISVN